jgi:hypothetical protein
MNDNTLDTHNISLDNVRVVGVSGNQSIARTVRNKRTIQRYFLVVHTVNEEIFLVNQT